MKAKALVLACAGVLVVGSWFVLGGRRPEVAAQERPATAGQVGRYRLVTGGTADNMIMLDTTTGKLWRWDSKFSKWYVAAEPPAQ
jgi:hypothetical protein